MSCAPNTAFLTKISKRLRETCAELIEPNATTPAMLANREGVTRWAIYKRRRRAEAALGVSLPRRIKTGRRRTVRLTSIFSL